MVRIETVIEAERKEAAVIEQAQSLSPFLADYLSDALMDRITLIDSLGDVRDFTFETAC